MDLDRAIEQLEQEVEKALSSATESKEIEVLRVKYLGKKGPIQGLMGALRTCSAEERPRVGKRINDLKESLELHFDRALAHLSDKELTARLASERIDVTLPGRRRAAGRKHVVLKMLGEAIDILVGMGFSVQYGPDIESDYYNFEALNFSKDHPARDMQDTFYISSDTVLRTHTSNTQVRVMESNTPPIRVICPGKCFRNEDVSARSHVIFHQIEGFYIDKDVTFADLLGTLEEFFHKLFHKDLKFRYRPSYFPFVEPGMEVDMSCLRCGGEGCSICKQSGWLEVLGAGMIHPEVLKNGGIDPEEYSGYAWGMGIERLALLRYNIPDIRYFFENRMDFLRQF